MESVIKQYLDSEYDVSIEASRRVSQFLHRLSLGEILVLEHGRETIEGCLKQG